MAVLGGTAAREGEASGRPFHAAAGCQSTEWRSCTGQVERDVRRKACWPGVRRRRYADARGFGQASRAEGDFALGERGETLNLRGWRHREPGALTSSGWGAPALNRAGER